MKIVPLPYVKIFTNEEGEIETQCNLNNAPRVLCDLLYCFLIDHRDIGNEAQEGIYKKHLTLVTQQNTESLYEGMFNNLDYEKALESYSKPIQVEFRLGTNYKGEYICHFPSGSYPMEIRNALEIKAKLSVDEAIMELTNKSK